MMKQRRRMGLSLIELLVVIAVVAILVGLLLPAVQGARERARSASCANKLRQLALATQAFTVDSGDFPPAYAVTGPVGKPGEVFDAFPVQCLPLPYLDQRALYDSLNFTNYLEARGNEPFRPCHWTAAGTRVDAFLCPSDVEVVPGWHFGVVSYRACIGGGTRRVAPPNPAMFVWDGAFVPSKDRTGNLAGTTPLSSFRDGLAYPGCSRRSRSGRVSGAGTTHSEIGPASRTPRATC